MNKRTENLVRGILKAIGENPDRDGLLDTPARFLKALAEMTAGNNEDPREHLRKDFLLEEEIGAGRHNEIILSGPLPFVSVCEHHLLPFEGEAFIGYIPRNIPGFRRRVVGVSKLARCLDGYARRLQIQEHLTNQVAQAIQDTLQPNGVAVLIRARHSCQCLRGIRKGGNMVTTATRGDLYTTGARQEFLDLVALADKI